MKSMIKVLIDGGNREADVVEVMIPRDRFFADDPHDVHSDFEYYAGKYADFVSAKGRRFSDSSMAALKNIAKAADIVMKLADSLGNARLCVSYYDANDGGVITRWIDASEATLTSNNLLLLAILYTGSQLKRTSKSLTSMDGYTLADYWRLSR